MNQQIKITGFHSFFSAPASVRDGRFGSPERIPWSLRRLFVQRRVKVWQRIQSILSIEKLCSTIQFFLFLTHLDNISDK